MLSCEDNKTISYSNAVMSSESVETPLASRDVPRHVLKDLSSVSSQINNIPVSVHYIELHSLINSFLYIQSYKTCSYAIVPRLTMVQSSSGTLVKPPPIDPSKSQIENVLELTPIADIGPVSHLPPPLTPSPHDP